MRDGEAGAFVGAGLSRAAGFVDWKGLLQEFADDLNLDLQVEQDLTLVAQYHLNREPARSRERLHRKLVSELSDAVSSPAHDALASLPLDVIWTSNYDSLVEDALRRAGRNVRVKNSSFTLRERGAKADATVFKLHGDLTDPSTIVLTRDDYREYPRRFPGFRERLKNDLSERTLLFLGFSFEDPHLELILNELRLDFGEAMREHFVIFRREPLGRRGRRRGYERNRQELKIEDLQSYGVRTLLVDSYEEIPGLLRDLEIQFRRSRVFVSGAADDFGPMGQEALENTARDLGKWLIANDYDIVSGFGKGIGPHLISGALEELYSDVSPNLERRLILRPFPYGANRRDLYTKYRRDMLSTAGFAIFLCGNKRSADGHLVFSEGMREEFRIAIEFGAVPLPIASTGWVAEELWPEVKANWAEHMSTGTRRRDFNVLRRETAGRDEVLAALGRLMSANRWT